MTLANLIRRSHVARIVDRSRQGILLAFLAYASWGLLSPVGKHLLDAGFPTLGLNAVRFAIAAVLVLAAIGPRAAAASLRLCADPKVFLANLLANVSLTMFLFSLTRLEATYATLGFYTAPLWTAVLAFFALGERVGKWFVPAALGLAAGGYLTLFGLAAPAGIDALGMSLAILSGLVWAFYAVYLRKAAPDIPLRPLMGASFVLGAVYYGILALALEGVPDLGLVADNAGWMAVYVLVPTIASFVLFSASLQRAPASLVNLMVGAELGFTAIFASLLFGATFTAVQLAGLGVVLASVTAYLWSVRGEPASG